MRKIVYLCGPISSSDPDKQRANINRFSEVEDDLTSQGQDIHNPARYEGENTQGFDNPYQEWCWFMARDVVFICRNKPKMYALKGWENSKGTLLELEIAKYLGLEIETE